MRKINQLPLQTANLFVGFMVWVLISSLLPFIKQDIELTDGESALVTAVPVLLGSILRVPFGYLANRFGARTVFTASFIVLVIPVYLLSNADSYPDLLLGGFLLGVGGAIFSVGVTSLPKYYPRNRHGVVNGVYGAGNLGTAVTAFFAPVLASSIGWSMTIQLYIILLLGFTLMNSVAGDRSEPKVVTSVVRQVRSVCKNEKLWFLSLCYFITFGSFVAFTVYLPGFLVSHFGMSAVDAGFRTAGFILTATVFRPIGGWLADRFNSYKVLIFVFLGFILAAILLSFAPSLPYYRIGCLTIAVCAGIGNGTVFKLVPLYFQNESGIVNGVVSAIGGLGGFFPPVILTVLFEMTGHYAIGFMALSQIATASMILVVWMYHQEKVKWSSKVLEHVAGGIMITDRSGKITYINPAFTTLTGYQKEEVLGHSPSILKSGKQNGTFYEKMWKELREQGKWEGEIWNKKKDGTIYLEWLSINRIIDETGDIKYYVGVFSDITTVHNDLSAGKMTQRRSEGLGNIQWSDRS